MASGSGPWQFRLFDTLTGRPLGELLDADPRQVKFPLDRRPTFGFTVKATHQFAYELALDDKTLVLGYDSSTGSKVLRFGGPVISHEKAYQSDGSSSLAVTCAGVRWFLQDRLIGKSVAGFTRGDPATATLVDRGQIAIDVLADANDAGDTGIRVGTVSPSVGGTAGPLRYKRAEEAVADLSAPLDGFDWEVEPLEPAFDAQGLVLGRLNIAAKFGTDRPNCVWEFGTGKSNVEAWRDLGDATALCNSGYLLPPNFPDNTTDPVAHFQDDVAIADRRLHEALIEVDQPAADLRAALVAEHVRIRKVPKRVIAFTPIIEDLGVPDDERRVPRLWTDYDVGDSVRFRAVEHFEVRDNAGAVIAYEPRTTVDAWCRIFMVTLDINKEGVVRPTVSLLEEEAG